MTDQTTPITGNVTPAENPGSRLIKPRAKYDWNALKIEWLQTNESPFAFQRRKGIKNDTKFYKHVNEDGWWEARDEINKRAVEIAQDKLVKITAKKWGDYKQLFNAGKSQAAKILSDTVKDGKMVRTLTTLELSQLVGAVDKMLKAESFMEGGPTERVETANFHMMNVDLIGKVERGEI